MGERHELDVGSLVRSIKKRFEGTDTEPQTEGPSICRILPSIRKINSGAYDPKIISIGPFHQGKQDLQPMEQLKWRFLNDLIRRSPNNSLENYFKRISSLEPQARKHYWPPVTTNRDAFVETMVLDVCFIIEFLLKLRHKADHLYTVKWILPHLRDDLLLLENQLPFFVLLSLFDLSNIEDPVTLTELAMHYVTDGKTDPLPNLNPIYHLLHLLHSTLQPNPPPRGEKSRAAPRRIPNAVQLQEAGVKFKKKKGRCFLDVEFINGTVEIPPLTIRDSTIPQFHNLIAFEQSCRTAGSHFTSYVYLMDNLIDKPDDVALLEHCGILESMLGDKVEVSHFFNSICNGAFLDYENHYLKNLFIEVENYCEVATHRWRAMLMHKYFSNPWAIISLVAATVLLILTALQTFYTVFPYYHHR